MTRWAEFIGAASLLTRLPVGGLAARHPAPAACIWAYPLVGALAGAAGAASHAVLSALGADPAIAALAALGATILVTGALHEDGLADLADGLGGGRTVDRKLAIMRDSRIGSYGALALGFSLAVRGVALAHQARPELSLILTGALARSAMLVPVLLLRPARADGLGALLGPAPPHLALAGLALALPAALLAPIPAAAAACAGLAITLIAQRQIGGYTGDVLGAAEQAAECAALAAA